VQVSGGTTPCKVTPVILHGVVSPDARRSVVWVERRTGEVRGLVVVIEEKRPRPLLTTLGLFPHITLQVLNPRASLFPKLACPMLQGYLAHKKGW